MGVIPGDPAPQPHRDCNLDENCGTNDCPGHIGAVRRLEAVQASWSPLALGRDAGNERHFVDGRAVFCGDVLELQARKYLEDDFGSYPELLDQGVLVRYEASFQRMPPIVTLYATQGSHEFTAHAHVGMRFRWPR